jgi:hypothetical protein
MHNVTPRDIYILTGRCAPHAEPCPGVANGLGIYRLSRDRNSCDPWRPDRNPDHQRLRLFGFLPASFSCSLAWATIGKEDEKRNKRRSEPSRNSQDRFYIFRGGITASDRADDFLRGASSPPTRSIGFCGPRCPWHGARGGPACRSLRLGRRPWDFLVITLLQIPRPHHVLRPRDRYRTITPLFLIGVLPEPVHAALSDAEISAITHFARVPGKELPQEAPSNPVPVCPPPALADLHDAHPHPGFTMWQHSAHIENPPVVQNVTQLSGFPSAPRHARAVTMIYVYRPVDVPDHAPGVANALGIYRLCRAGDSCDRMTPRAT